MAGTPPRTLLVIGAGLGGLAFAQILRHSPLVADPGKYRVIIFERDATPAQRGQGYQLGIKHSGRSRIACIPHLAGLLEISWHKGFGTIVNGDLDVMAEFKREPGPDPTAVLVTRGLLRNALSQGLEIQWGKKFVRYEEFETCVVAHFDDGTQASGDLLIGADGSRSRVRLQRCPALKLQPVPIMYLAGTIAVTPDTIAMVPNLVQLAAKSNICFCLAEGNTVLVMEYYGPDGQKRLHWALSFPAPISVTLPTDRHKLKQVIDERAAMLGKELASLIHGTEAEDYVFHEAQHFKAIVPTDENPLGQTSRVTLLGDAAHCMTPHQGLGTNTAFADASDLVRALTHEDDPWQALAQYEQIMIKRGFANIRQSLRGSQMIHSIGIRRVIRNTILRVIGWVQWLRAKLAWIASVRLPSFQSLMPSIKLSKVQ